MAEDALPNSFEPVPVSGLLNEPAGCYATHRDYLKRAMPAAEERGRVIRQNALDAFQDFLTEERCVVINFRDMNATVLGRILANYPVLAKPLMILCNVAERAIERDLGLKGLNSYNPRFRRDSAKALAGYLKPFLPDRIELDAGYPASGTLEIGVDVKRIEARRDIHKRCDEIVNKAAKFKGVYPSARFVAFIYYPFTDEHTNVSNRLKSEDIDVVVFAGEHPDSIRNAAIAALRTKTS